jgi:hypothetical protein
MYIDEINANVDHVYIDESLTALLRKGMQQPLRQTPGPKNYFYVTHLTNPAQTYWSFLKPEIQKPPELRRRLAKGVQLQSIASTWFKSLPNFMVEEGKLEGGYVGLKGVRGSIDYRIGDSIFELKTKDEIPTTHEDVFEKFPHDLEQLAFYSVLHPSRPKDNYLVFMENKRPLGLKVFKVTTTDQNVIISLIKERMKLLKDAIEKNDPSKLGRCRYYQDHCHLEGICKCSNAGVLDISKMRKALKVQYDDKFTKELNEVKNQSKTKEVYSVWDILNPRLNYMKTIEGKDQAIEPNAEKEAYDACLWISIRDLPLQPSASEKTKIKRLNKEPRLYTSFRWLRTINSAKSEEEVVPYIQKVSGVTDKRRAGFPNPTHIAQLGIVCASYGKSKGLIIVVYPQLNKLVQVFQVVFKNPAGMLQELKKKIDEFEEAKREKALYSLPPCMDFINKKRDCPMTNLCHKYAGSGCIPKLVIK